MIFHEICPTNQWIDTLFEGAMAIQSRKEQSEDIEGKPLEIHKERILRRWLDYCIPAGNA